MSAAAVVLSGTGGVWRVREADGTEHDASMRGRLKLPGGLKLAVGDEVMLEHDGAATIAEVLPRRSTLVRRAPGNRYDSRVVVANVDQVVVVFAVVKPEPHRRMLDRFLVVAESNEIPARIVVNKVDLDPRANEQFADYERAGYPVHYTSVKKALGLQELGAVLAGRVSALTGPSGVGKSSLLNAIYPGLNLRVGEISESVNKGRHTTVGALMHPLPDGGDVVDTPGLREVGVWGVDAASLAECFPEFGAGLGACKFRDCRHVAEPGCAVRALVSSGAVSAERYDSYLRLLAEVEGGES
ncbi:MAG TPA: ribosome small subunit-dependent GTPase A [Gemmatimonadaceae bacterium]|nr:ribosome small subunit-dependent GTPase A [Gemmatimonadaceae bacterium]